MSDQRRHISEFSDFEPEVDDAAIARSWEKLKYLLPPEKKRRRGILFFIRTGTGRSLAILGVLSLLLGTILYLREPIPEKKTVGQADPVSKKSEAISEAESSPEKNKAEEQHKKPVQHSRSAPSEQKGAVPKHPLSDVTLKGPAGATGREIPPKHAGTGNQQGDDTGQQAENDHTPVRDAEPGAPAHPGSDNNSAIVGVKDPSAKDVPVPAVKDTIVTAGVQDTVVYLTPVSDKLFYERPEDPVRLSLQMPPGSEPKISRWMIDLAGGINQARTLAEAANQSGTEYKKTGFSGSLALAYRLGRWHVMGRFGFNGNNFEHKDEQVAGYKVVEKKGYGFVSPFTVDTVVSYLVAHTSTSSRTRSFYNAGLGLACRVSREWKTQLEAFVMLDLKSSVYQATSRNYLGTDTLKYLQTQASGPLQKQVTSLNEDLDETHRLSSWGLTPGFTYSYFLTNRMSLILRPSYFIQLSKNTIRQGMKDFKIGQNNLYLEAGIRFRL